MSRQFVTTHFGNRKRVHNSQIAGPNVRLGAKCASMSLLAACDLYFAPGDWRLLTMLDSIADAARGMDERRPTFVDFLAQVADVNVEDVVVSGEIVLPDVI